MASIPINAITVGERRREDLGDVAALAHSLSKYGLIQPIVIDGACNLVCGGRRLAAADRLGWKEIDVRSLGELTDDERAEIELEENEQRKALTDIERSKQLVRKAVAVAPIISSVAVEKDSRGRKSSYDAPKTDIAEALGVGKTTLIRAEQHVAAVEQFPELEALSQQPAIDTAKLLNDLPAPKRENVVKAVRKQIADGVDPKAAITTTIQANGLPTPKQADTLARETGIAVAATDGVYHDGRSEQELNAVKADTKRLSDIYRALEALSVANLTPAQFVTSVPVAQEYRVDAHLDAAVKWLNQFSQEWKACHFEAA